MLLVADIRREAELLAEVARLRGALGNIQVFADPPQGRQSADYYQLACGQIAAIINRALSTPAPDFAANIRREGDTPNE
ncbi:MAG TPA: hypothetical protein VN442_14210 [Bryobacteraceae bacterium]|nr:hypothetical protein [Bryobacteraceae bacterium]